MTLLRQGGKVFCVDTFCGHQGGPLGELGDLEELSDGTACIKCPWHNFRVRPAECRYVSSFWDVLPHRLEEAHSLQNFPAQFDLQSGCRVEKGLCPGELQRSEPQQRMHPVYNDGDWIWCAACVHLYNDTCFLSM